MKHTLLIITALMLVVGCGGSGESSQIDLNNVTIGNYPEGFRVTNDEKFNLYNVILRLNGGDFKYRPSSLSIRSGQTITIGHDRFTNRDNRYYNPYQVRAENISISCDLKPEEADGKTSGWSYFEWSY